jgi:hypothetical protein
MSLVKRMISFTDRQVAFLDREAKRVDISVAELVRRIVDGYIDHGRYPPGAVGESHARADENE